MANLQVISKQDLRPDGHLQVHHMFPTIQGEGPFAGYRAIFIRLAGCNLQCPLCDTDYTSIGDRLTVDEKLSPEQILERVRRYTHEREETWYHNKPYLIVISGGEPFRQNIQPVISILLGSGYKVQIETNGTLHVPIYRHPDLKIVCSPKTGRLDERMWHVIDALKYIIHADEINWSDGLPFKSLNHSAFPEVARPPDWWKGPIYIQPVDVGDKTENLRHQKAAVESCQQFGHILSLQLHKILNLE